MQKTVGLTLCLIYILMFCCNFILAGGTGKCVEKRLDRREISQDRAAVADDRADLDQLSDLLLRWDEMRQSENRSEGCP